MSTLADELQAINEMVGLLDSKFDDFAVQSRILNYVGTVLYTKEEDKKKAEKGEASGKDASEKTPTVLMHGGMYA